MAGFLATGTAILINGLALLGMAFILSRGFPWLRARPARHRAIILGIAFSAMTMGTMTMSYSMGPGFIGDLRHVVIAVAAIVGGPIPALVAALTAMAYRILSGGQWVVAVLGIAVATGLSIGFVRLKLRKTPRNLALLGFVLASAIASLPIASLLFSTVSAEDAVRVSTRFITYMVFVFPIGIVVIGGLLQSEERRADEEAELKTLNATLSVQTAREQGVFESSGVAIAWVDLATGLLTRANPQYAKFTGYSEAELIGKRFDELAVPEEREKDFAEIKSLEAGELTFVTDEKRYLRTDGEVMWGLRSLTAVKEDGAPRYAFVVLQDITERKRARAEIEHLASHDSLTGVYNRLVFHSRLEEAIARRKPDEIVAVFFHDLDDFKMINDTLGHPAGDAILIEIARRLTATLAKDDIVARLGGNEFAVLRRGVANESDVRALAELLHDRITEPYATGGDPVKAHVSIGIALGPRDGKDADALIKKADIALHTAKATDGSPYLFFQPEMEEQLVAREELKIDLVAAMANDELIIEYQPSVDLRTGAVTSFEALLRWRHPLKGIIPPSEFIPLAEETGLIVAIGDWVLNQACREAGNWPASVAVAVNVSAAQFHGRLFALRVAEVLAKSGLNPRRLELEITETLLLSGSEDNLQRLRDLRHLGVKIALDDFGTGYSSLGYLQLFPFDRIKIDRSFVVGLATRPESRTLVGALIELGHSLRMRITAEGVETQEQLDYVSAKGCDEVQGFLFSKSVPSHDVPALIARLVALPKMQIGAAG
jgi:diguanylate cyclase (GGDEF)-like protein/PAS domain S-box-containing protein